MFNVESWASGNQRNLAWWLWLAVSFLSLHVLWSHFTAATPGGGT